MSPVRILIFSKAPIPGRVKTRFIPTLGATGAARLASHLLRHTLTQALAAALGPLELCASPPSHTPIGLASACPWVSVTIQKPVTQTP